MASGDDGGTVKIWSMETFAEVKSFKSSTSGETFALSYSKDSKTLVAGGSDQKIRFYSTENNGYEEKKVLEGHTGRVRQCVFSPD